MIYDRILEKLKLQGQVRLNYQVASVIILFEGSFMITDCFVFVVIFLKYKFKLYYSYSLFCVRYNNRISVLFNVNLFTV